MIEHSANGNIFATSLDLFINHAAK